MADELILVCDDSRENREFIIDYILKPNRFVAIEARDGIEALEQVRTNPPDLILLDLQMPRLDGRGVLEALARQNSTTPVILMTFHGSEEISIEMFRLGARDYVKKPYTPEEMLASIETNLTEARLRQEKKALTARLLNANRDLHNRVKELNTLYSIGKSVTAQLNLSQLLARIVEAATVLTQSEQGKLILIEDEQLVLRATRRQGDQHAHSTKEVIQDRMATRAIQTGQPVLISAAEMGLIRQRDPAAPQSMLLVPLQIGNRTIGVLSVENISPNARSFVENDGALLSALADYAAIGIENARNFLALQGATANPDLTPSSLTRLQPTMPNPSRRAISVLVAELRGFPYADASISPSTVITGLDQYLSAALNAISSREGLQDRIFGDTVAGLFNVNRIEENHIARALDAAYAISESAVALNHQQGLTIKYAVGLASGEATLGTVGETYAAVGDVVNIARRLQELAEPGQILVDENVARSIGTTVKLEALGRVKIKGANVPVNVYTVKPS